MFHLCLHDASGSRACRRVSRCDCMGRTADVPIRPRISRGVRRRRRDLTSRVRAAAGSPEVHRGVPTGMACRVPRGVCLCVGSRGRWHTARPQARFDLTYILSCVVSGKLFTCWYRAFPSLPAIAARWLAHAAGRCAVLGSAVEDSGAGGLALLRSSR
jgi:hypothetical protein